LEEDKMVIAAQAALDAEGDDDDEAVGGGDVEMATA
jgi:hypothetical protein